MRDVPHLYYERAAFCRERKEVWIEPCNHGGTWGPKGNYTDNGNGTHTLTCNYCAGGTSPHTLEPEGFCTLCSYDPTGTVYQKATTEQQALVEQLYSEWQGMNSGEEDDDSTVKTDVNDSYTD